MDLMYWSVLLSSRSGGDGVKGYMLAIVILASCEFHSIRVNENLVQHPSNGINYLLKTSRITTWINMRILDAYLK